ncbi:phosphoenolpyruvate--protein phosphotransferase [Kiritimatiella glycovorans]|uniref:Phosphoenolpyruvate-protein phosphotransferase n=1 Tax=Kiritimatiella glycovorans TaxID=1307763 RepID=A0A0G3EIR6_9BACT|nr:phosphoenolpyruvate--protein phosphotransferase [Kiritimatiella glycovorans]AKJ64059.1 Phosphoenolpyruvate-protein phosphotransferase [Kiritimatiella glycovorans]
MTSSKQQGRRETVLRGIGVAPGVVSGEVRLIRPEKVEPPERNLAKSEIPKEIERFEEALSQTREQLHRIQSELSQALGREDASIFDAHLMVADDRSFIEEVIREIKEQRRNVESVLVQVSGKYADVLSGVEDQYLSERAADVKDVTQRILRNLMNLSETSLRDLKEPCVVVAPDLSPSDTATIDREVVRGFATNLGSSTSHTAIMAQTMEIPAVVGLHDVTRRVAHGDRVLIDGGKGLFIINPTAKRMKEYGKRAEEQRHILHELEQLREQPAKTADGYAVRLSANIEWAEELRLLRKHGASGVGLFRSEYLFLNRAEPPSEDSQADVYGSVARELAPEPVVIRTLDVGGDRILPSEQTSNELNPFLGWRAIRFCLDRPDIFRPQLRAILRASRHGNVRIMYPMVCCTKELKAANRMLEKCKDELRDEGVEFDENIPVGVMIEIPSAALCAELFAPHVDFFSLGTNDLIQYTLAVDRVNDHVSHLYEPTHLAILKLLQYVVEAGHKNDIWVSICGEMAGDPVLAPLLIGLGIDELSVTPILAPMIKDVIRKLKYSDARELAQKCMQYRSPVTVRRRCRELTREIAGEVLELLD